MRKYFYAKGNEQIGPLTFEELKNADIKSDTLIWYEGLSNWQPAESLEDLKEIFELIPPPLESESLISSNESEKSFHDSLSKFERKKQRMFTNVFSIDGRIRRFEYGLSIIFFYILLVLTMVLQKMVGSDLFFLIWFLLQLPLYIALFTQGVKRCHDRGNSGWFQFIPFYALWMIFADGDPGLNKYGPNPKGLSLKILS